MSLKFIVMLPFIAMSIEFFIALGPAVIYFRKETENKVVAHYRSTRIYQYALSLFGGPRRLLYGIL